MCTALHGDETAQVSLRGEVPCCSHSPTACPLKASRASSKVPHTELLRWQNLKTWGLEEGSNHVTRALGLSKNQWHPVGVGAGLLGLGYFPRDQLL